MTSKQDREFDVIVYGAASFVGKILCHYLNQRHGTDGELKWAIAGRNQAKLDELNADLGTSLPSFIADAADRSALDSLAGQTRVICTTVGPYALYGSDVVAASVEQGTDYVDLTGEPQWMARMIDKHEARAKETGARIVHNCGFDSLPSDLGVWYTQQQAKADLGEFCSQIRMGVKAAKGGASGGTIASMLNAFSEVAKDSEVRKLMQNPYAIAPEQYRKGVRQLNVAAPEYDADAGSWLAPFVMAGINTRVVHRSHGLAGQPWGADFLYDESMMTGDGMKGRLKAAGIAGGTGGFVGLVALPPTRKLLERFVLPAPGEGPTPEEQEAGFYDMRFFGTTASGKKIVCKVTGDRDPGYGSTGKMLGEAAVCLATEIGEDVPGGFPTPSIAFGDKLIKRLVDHAGLTFQRI